MNDRLWTGPIVAGALVFMAGIVVGAVATDRHQGAKLDAFLDGREHEATAAQLAICRERSAALERFRPDVTSRYSEVVR